MLGKPTQMSPIRAADPFGVVGPRCCPNCPNVGTVWWALAIDGYTEDMLTEAQRATVRRIAGEPQSIAVLSE